MLLTKFLLLTYYCLRIMHSAWWTSRHAEMVVHALGQPNYTTLREQMGLPRFVSLELSSYESETLQRSSVSFLFFSNISKSPLRCDFCLRLFSSSQFPEVLHVNVYGRINWFFFHFLAWSDYFIWRRRIILQIILNFCNVILFIFMQCILLLPSIYFKISFFVLQNVFIYLFIRIAQMLVNVPSQFSFT